MEVDRFAEIFYSGKEQIAGDLGKLRGTIRPALDRYYELEPERQDMFKSTLQRFNRIYSFVTQVCRLFDKEIHKFSVYARFLSMQLPKGHGEHVDVDDKVLLEYYRLEKDFDGAIELESAEGGFVPITGEAGRREQKKDPLTVLIDKINERYGTNFTEMDKVLVQMENDYAAQSKWQSYARNNDRKTFMLLFEKDFPNMAAQRYEQNDDFFVRLFSEPELMKQVMETVGSVLYQRLRKRKTIKYTTPSTKMPLAADAPGTYKN
jgi:type I restriction enzyme R subunit